MNEFSFKVLDLINRYAVDSACWGVCDGFNRQSFDNDEPDVFNEGRFLYYFDSADQSDLTLSQLKEFEDNCFTQIYVLNNDDSLSGVYYFFKLD